MLINNGFFSVFFSNKNLPSQPWGSGFFVWNTDDTLVHTTAGGNCCKTTERSILQGLQKTIKTVLAHAQGQGGDTQIGITVNFYG